MMDWVLLQEKMSRMSGNMDPIMQALDMNVMFFYNVRKVVPDSQSIFPQLITYEKKYSCQWKNGIKKMLQQS